MPVIAIVGRPNVGKSSLLNALVGKRISIVQNLPGVTRDRVSMPLEIDGRFVEMVDTGGYGFEDEQGLTKHIRHQIDLAMARADLVLFLVDLQAGLTSADEQIASLLRRKNIKTILIANKADGPTADAGLGDFARLGLGTPVGVSAMNSRNLDQVLAQIRGHLDLGDAPTAVPEPEMLLAIVGKRNAGKSTLVNSIANIYEDDPERVIVSEIPGTTRDSVDVRFEKEGKTLVVIDTAGVRKKRHMTGGANDIEFYSFHRAQRSIRRADVVLMLIEGPSPVSEPDKKLAAYIAEQNKPVILVVNKWDLVLENARRQAAELEAGFSDDLLMNEFGTYLDQELKQVDYAPVIFLTAKEGRNVQKVLDLAQHLFKQANTRMGTGELNRVVKQIFQERVPSTPRGQRIKVYYATQTDVSPPTIVLFVNAPELVNESYQRFLVNRFRELLPFPEVPIKLHIRGRVRGATPEPSEDGDEQKRPARAKALPRSNASSRLKQTAHSKRPPRVKPNPKKETKRGPGRGTRPR
jgi:GTP-binding protein